MDAPLPSCLARDAIYGWPRVRTWDVELNLTKNLDYFILQVFVTTSFDIPVISKLSLLPYCSKWFRLISYDMKLLSRLFIFMRKRWFSTWRSFTIASFKLSTALSNPSKQDHVFSSRLIIRSEVFGSDISFFYYF